MNIDLRLGDCLEVLKTIPDNSIDSVVTDPPYHLTSIVKRFGKEDSAPAQFGTDGAYARASKGFMGKEWDGGDIAFRTDVWEECLRILKPGGHLLAFSHSRTYHRMGVAIEDAGFEIRDQIMWVYGSGFPKSHNIGKAIDKIEGNEREVLGKSENHRTSSALLELGFQDGREEHIITKGNSEWEGWGTALKPAHEPIVMARKPLSEKSIAENVLKHGTGGINIDGSRIGTDEITTNGYGDKGFVAKEGYEPSTHQGRFPANIIFDEEAGQLLDEQSGIGKGQKNPKVQKGSKRYGENQFTNGGMMVKDGWVSSTYDDKGGASRFFYCPKAAKSDRNEGLDNEPTKIKNRVNSGGLENDPKWGPVETKNNHPTVKPTDLMRYLINLITPPNGTTLDPFMGSGSTGKAAVRCGVNFIGIEKEQEYMDIASARIEHEKNKPIQTKLL
jgi:site-specific DNA-methyltransferase (adenine-specific)